MSLGKLLTRHAEALGCTLGPAQTRRGCTVTIPTLLLQYFTSQECEGRRLRFRSFSATQDSLNMRSCTIK